MAHRTFTVKLETSMNPSPPMMLIFQNLARMTRKQAKLTSHRKRGLILQVLQDLQDETNLFRRLGDFLIGLARLARLDPIL